MAITKLKGHQINNDLDKDNFTQAAIKGMLEDLGDDADPDFGNNVITAESYVSDVATGTAPFSVTSSTKVLNLNADKLDDQTGTYYLDFGNFAIEDDEIPIAKLASDSLTIGSTTTALGATSTSLAGLQQLTVDDLDLNGQTISTPDGNKDIHLSPHGDGSVDCNSSKLTNVLNPTNLQDAATKSYVDSLEAGLDIKASVRVASTAHVDVNESTVDGQLRLTATGNGGLVVDGVSLSVGDSLLWKDQDAGDGAGLRRTHGIYEVVSIGDGGNPFVIGRRMEDAGATGEITSGMFTFVAEGTAQADSGWVCTTNDDINLGVTQIVYTQFSQAGVIEAGDGMTKTANVINVVAGTMLDVAADVVNVDLSEASVATIVHGDELIFVDNGAAGGAKGSTADLAALFAGPGMGVGAGDLASQLSVKWQRNEFTGNGTTDVFALSAAAMDVQSTFVFVNGLYMDIGAGDDCQLNNARTELTYTDLPTGDKMIVISIIA